MSSPIENFAQTTTDFLDALALIPGNKRAIAPENEWSAAYVVHHVADGELHFAARYLHTLGSDNPTMVFLKRSDIQKHSFMPSEAWQSHLHQSWEFEEWFLKP